jgi:hypothetical protein
MRLPILILLATCCALTGAKADDPPEANKACAEYYFGYSQLLYNLELSAKHVETKEKLQRLISDCQKSIRYCANTLKHIPKAIEKNDGKSLPAEFTLTCPGAAPESPVTASAPAAASAPAVASANDKIDPPEAISACSDYYRVLDSLFEDGKLAEPDKLLVAPSKLRRTMADCGKSRRYCLNTVENIGRKRRGIPLPASFTLTCPQR